MMWGINVLYCIAMNSHHVRRAVAEYKKQKDTVDSLKTELQASINQHTIAAESHSEVEAKVLHNVTMSPF